MDSVSAYVAVGSNIEPETHIPSALTKLKSRITVSAVSTHYRTAPLGNRSDQDDYLNGVWRLETIETPHVLRQLFRSMEMDYGRLRTSDKYGPRTLDLDLLLWAELVDSSAGLPDMDILERPFLYEALLEFDENLIWPLTRRPLRDIVPYGRSASLISDEYMTGVLRGLIDG